MMRASSPPRRRLAVGPDGDYLVAAHHHRFSPWALRIACVDGAASKHRHCVRNRPVSEEPVILCAPRFFRRYCGVMSQLLHISANRPQCVGSQVGDCRIAVYRHQQFSLRQDGS